MATKRKGVSLANQTIDADREGRLIRDKPGHNSGPEFPYVRVADRAYYLWLEHGMPERGAMDFWLQAEAEMKQDQAGKI